MTKKIGMQQSVDKTILRFKTAMMPPVSSPTTDRFKIQQSNNTEIVLEHGFVAPVQNMSTTTGHHYRYTTAEIFIIEFTAGALGGAVSRTITAPIDRLRTIFQVDSCEGSKKNPSQVFRYMLVEGKWQGLWRGNLVNVLKTAPESAIRFATYEKLKSMLNKNRQVKANPIEEKLACGSAAGFIATLSLYPLKTVKTMMNLGKSGEYKSIADCIHQLYMKYGMKGFYRGLVCNSVAIIPSTGIDLAAYETSKKLYSDFVNKPEPNNTEKVLIGMASSTVGNFVVYPLLFARTRLQSNRNQSETTLNLLKKIWTRDGLRGVYTGFGLHILKIAPAAGISYITFESFLKAFEIDSLK